MQANVTYTVRIAELGTPVPNLVAPACTDLSGQKYTGGFHLTFDELNKKVPQFSLWHFLSLEAGGKFGYPVASQNYNDVNTRISFALVLIKGYLIAACDHPL